MHADDAVVDLAVTTQPLPCGTNGMHAAFGRSGFVEAADGLRVRVLAGNQQLAVVAHAGLIPLDRFHETLYSAWRLVELQGDGLDVLALQVREQSLDINSQQGKTSAAAKAARKQCEKPGQLLAEAGNLLQRHPDDPPWYSSRNLRTRRIVFFPLPMQAQHLVPAALTYNSSKKVALSN
jgi:hypothetical protein